MNTILIYDISTCDILYSDRTEDDISNLYKLARRVNMSEKIIRKYIPLTEATYYILLSMVEPIHGYKLMQNVEEMTSGKVKLGPGTLYGATSKLVKDEIIEQVITEDERRKSYKLTSLGKEILKLEYERLNLLVDNGKEIINNLGV